MSGLLQRLAVQALGANGASANPVRIRPAASFHSQVPVGMSAQSAQDFPTPPLFTRAVPEAQDVAQRAPVTPSVRHRDTERVISNGASDRQLRPPELPPVPGARPRGVDTAAVPAFSAPPFQSSQTLESRAPQPLLEGMPTTPTQERAVEPITPPRMAIDAGQTHAGTEATEVHVHIGRIEVTAVQESAAPKRPRTTAPRNTLPLGEYLARRRHT
jgi:hypothetical protein